MTDENDKLKILEFYREKKMSVHINTNIKTNLGEEKYLFYNGIIKEIKGRIIVLDEEKLGVLPIFISQILKVEPRLKKEIVEDENGDEALPPYNPNKSCYQP